jgi:heme-degrading monooxygenase HmoA
MYVRITGVKSTPDRIEQGIANFEQQVVPAVRQQPGYMGAALLVNRDTGDATGVTYWESLDALNASEEMGIQARTQAAGSMEAEVLDVDRFEMVIAERLAGEAKSHTFARANQLYAQPGRIDELIAFMRDNAASVMQQKGCRALLMGVNRMTGRCFVNSIWESAADREASEAAVTGLRKKAGEVAGGQASVTLGEVAFVELKQPAPRV